jgi:ubiquinone/menaquinone biosynthesis C-methylase UbiE
MTYQHNEALNVSAEYLKRIAQLSDVQAIKNYTHECMALAPGHHVLDLGCGPGVDTIALAQKLGEGGTVIGVDSDEKMLQQANEWAQREQLSHRLSHQQGDASNLAFADNTFNSSHAERLLQVLPAAINPQTVINELARVTQVGGRVVVADTDWGSFSMHSSYPHTERQLSAFFARQLRPNGFAGRQLLGLFHRANLTDISLKIFPIVHTNISALPLSWLHKEASQQNIIAPEDLSLWWQEVNNLSEQNIFYASVNMVVITGEVT